MIRSKSWHKGALLFIFMGFSNLSWSQDKLFPMRQYDQWGFIDKKGEWVIPARFDQARYFSDGLAAVAVEGKWGFVNKEGKMVIEPQFTGPYHRPKFKTAWGKPVYAQALEPFSEGLAPVIKDKKLVYINKKGEVVIEKDFKMANPFYNGLALAQTKYDLYGYLKPSGEWAIEPQYDFARDFSNGWAAVKPEDGEWHYINSQGEKMLQEVASDRFSNKNFSKPGPISEGLAPVEIRYDLKKDPMSSKSGFMVGNYPVYINKKGQVQFLHLSPETPGVFDEARPFSDGLAIVSNNKGEWVVNSKGEEVIAAEKLENKSEKIIHIDDFSNGMALVIFQPEDAMGFTCRGSGIWKFCSDAYYGYINLKGDFVYKQSDKEINYLRQKTDSVKKAKKRSEERQEAARKREEDRKDSMALAKVVKGPEEYVYGNKENNIYLDFQLAGIHRRLYFDEATVRTDGKTYLFRYPSFGTSSNEKQRAMAVAKEQMSPEERNAMEMFGGLFSSMIIEELSQILVKVKKSYSISSGYRAHIEVQKFTLPDYLAYLPEKYYGSLFERGNNNVMRESHLEILDGTKQKPEKIALNFQFKHKEYPENVISGQIITSQISPLIAEKASTKALGTFKNDSIHFMDVPLEYHKGKGLLRYNRKWNKNGRNYGSRAEVPVPVKDKNLSANRKRNSTLVYEFKALSEEEIFINVYDFEPSEKESSSEEPVIWKPLRSWSKRPLSEYPLTEKHLVEQVHSSRVKLFPLKPVVFTPPPGIYKTE